MLSQAGTCRRLLAVCLLACAAMAPLAVAADEVPSAADANVNAAKSILVQYWWVEVDVWEDLAHAVGKHAAADTATLLQLRVRLRKCLWAS